MTDTDLHRTLLALRDLGRPSWPPGQAEEEDEDINDMLAVAPQAGLNIDFNKNLVGKRDSDGGPIHIESRNLPAGTLLFVGLVDAGEQQRRWPLAVPTPFLRAFTDGLALGDNAARAEALLGLASRLSWSVIKETVLAEAARSARLVKIGTQREDLIARIDVQYPQPSGQAARPAGTIPEPDCEQGHYRGRFVMLRPATQLSDGPASQGRLSGMAAGGNWVALAKAIYFAAEVEAAPELARRSLAEACEFDPQSLPFWRQWLLRELAEDAAWRGELLAMLPER